MSPVPILPIRGPFCYYSLTLIQAWISAWWKKCEINLLIYSQTLTVQLNGILPKGPYPPCLRMADRAILAGYPWTAKVWKWISNLIPHLIMDVIHAVDWWSQVRPQRSSVIMNPHIQIHLLEKHCPLKFQWFSFLVDSKSSMLKSVAWYWTGGTPVPGTVTIKYNDTHICITRSW